MRLLALRRASLNISVDIHRMIRSIPIPLTKKVIR